MSQFEFFIIIFLLFLVATGACIWGAYSPAEKMWIKYTNICHKFFNLNKLPYIIKEYKFKYAISFIFFWFLNCFIFIIFLWLWIKTSQDLYQRENLLLTIPFIIIFLITNIIMWILFKKFWNQLKKIGFYSKKDAIFNFKEIKEKNKIVKVKNFKILKFDQITLQNNPFQFQQKRYQKKIRNLIKKNTEQEKYNLELLNLLINYLKIYSIFLTRIKTVENYNVIIEEKKESDILNILPDILINNFFAFIQQAEKNFNKKEVN